MVAVVHKRPKSAEQRSERLEARVSPEQKELFRYAAALQGRSVTDFIVSSIYEAAARAIQEHERMVLTARDRKAFISALLQAPEPHERLRAAAQRYKERIQIGG
jgi:uncharacterized protein (DUF1778 family)